MDFVQRFEPQPNVPNMEQPQTSQEQTFPTAQTSQGNEPSAAGTDQGGG
jgi:hypothetical protein